MIKHYENCAATTYAIPVMHKIKQKYLNDTQFRAMLDSTSEVNRRLDSQKIEVSDAHFRRQAKQNSLERIY